MGQVCDCGIERFVFWIGDESRMDPRYLAGGFAWADIL